MDEPLLDRKRVLRRLVPKRRRPGRIRYTDDVLRDGKAFFQKLENIRTGGDGRKAR
jgi:ATP-dependent DNA ligase